MDDYESESSDTFYDAATLDDATTLVRCPGVADEEKRAADGDDSTTDAVYACAADDAPTYPELRDGDAYYDRRIYCKEVNAGCRPPMRRAPARQGAPSAPRSPPSAARTCGARRPCECAAAERARRHDARIPRGNAPGFRTRALCIARSCSRPCTRPVPRPAPRGSPSSPASCATACIVTAATPPVSSRRAAALTISSSDVLSGVGIGPPMAMNISYQG